MLAAFFRVFPGFRTIGRWNSRRFFGMLDAGFHFPLRRFTTGVSPVFGCREGFDSMTLTMYGIKNCDTIKKARRWLEEQGVAYQFHDYRADGLDERLLRGFVERLGWEPLLNTRGTTWRKLDDAQRSACDNADAAIALMLAQPAIIKRPLLDDGQGHALLGFSAEGYQQFISEVAA